MSDAPADVASADASLTTPLTPRVFDVPNGTAAPSGTATGNGTVDLADLALTRDASDLPARRSGSGGAGARVSVASPLAAMPGTALAAAPIDDPAVSSRASTSGPGGATVGVVSDSPPAFAAHGGSINGGSSGAQAISIAPADASASQGMAFVLPAPVPQPLYDAHAPPPSHPHVHDAGLAAANTSNAPQYGSLRLGCSQLRAVMWKNVLVKSRNPCQLLCECLTPLLMMLLLVLGYQLSLQNLTPTPAAIYANNTGVWQSGVDAVQQDIYPSSTGGVNLTVLSEELYALPTVNLTGVTFAQLNASFVFFNSSVNISFPATPLAAANNLPPFIVVPLTPAAVALLSPVLNSTAYDPNSPATENALVLLQAFVENKDTVAGFIAATGSIPGINGGGAPNNRTCVQLPPVVTSLIPLQYCPELSRLIPFLRQLISYAGPTPVLSFDAYVTLHEQLQDVARQVNPGSSNPLESLNRLLDNRLGNLIYLGKLVFAPDTPQVHALVRHLNRTLTTFGRTFTGTFATEDDAVDDALTTDSRFNQAWAVVVFDEFDIPNGRVDYTIRMNYTTIPRTTTTKASRILGLDSTYQRYFWSGFSTLQQTIDQAALEMAYEHNPAAARLNLTINALSAGITAIPMPVAEYNQNPFFESVGPLLGLILTMSMLYPISRLIKGIVEEKETRTKEVMKMMGLLDWVFFFSWFLTAFLQFTVLALGQAAILHSSLLNRSSFSLVFMMFWGFAVSQISFSFLVSAFFSKAKLAGIVGPLIMFMTVIPRYAFFSSDDNGQLSEKNGVSLLAPTAFTFGADLMMSYEGANQGITWANLYSDPFPIGASLAWMFGDFFIYALIAWYLEYVLPNDYGQRKPWYFPCQKQTWCGPEYRKEDEHGNVLPSATPQERAPIDGVERGDHIEPAAAAFGASPLQIRKLRKTYATGTVAVKGLSLDMYENQITSLLGHNGAGKTTTISMLTGLLEPTDGDAYVHGYSVRNEMAQIRRSLGVCPQHNVLFEKLSVKEHLELYATLKGMSLNAHSRAEFEREVRDKIHDVGLDSRTNFYASALSGGMQRKLSVAIALIGGSRVVFLDEPTSGMDPYSRRATWELLRKSKAGRTIILTTHFMDEADLLGDRIAIMAGGELKCCGSSLFLKTRSGIGYTLTIVKGDASLCVPSSVTALIRTFVPDAAPLSAAGGELSYRLPLTAMPRFPELFAALEGKGRSELGLGAFGVAMTTLEEVFMRLSHDALNVKDEKDDDHANGNGNGNGAASAGSNGTPIAVKPRSLDGSGAAVDEKSAAATISGGPAWASATDALKPEPSNTAAVVRPLELSHLAVPLASAAHAPADKENSKSGNAATPLTATTLKAARGDAPVSVQIKELLRKRAICALRDLNGRFFEVILPVVVVALVLLILRLNINPAGPEVTLNAHMYSDGAQDSSLAPGQTPGAPYWYSEPGFRTEPRTLAYLNTRDTMHMIPTNYTTSLNMSVALLDTISSHDGNRYDAYVLDDRIDVPVDVNIAGFVANVTVPLASAGSVLHNSTFYHAIPVATAELVTARLRVIRAATDNSSVPTPSLFQYAAKNHPLPLTERESIRLRTFLTLFAALFILIPFCFLPASFMIFVVKERASKAKHLQLVSGVHPNSYWVANYIWDVANMFAVLLAVMMVFLAYQAQEFVGDVSNFFATFLLFLLYVVSVLPLSYIYAYLFDNHSSAQVGIAGMHFVTGFLLVITSFILDSVETTEDTNRALKPLYRCFPTFDLGEGLINIATFAFRKKFGLLGSPNDSVWDWPVISRSLVYMSVETVVFFACVLLIEQDYCRFGRFTAWVQHLLCGGGCSGSGNRPAAVVPVAGAGDAGAAGSAGLEAFQASEKEDEDVANERARVEGGEVNDMIVIRKLSKTYPARSGGTSVVACHSMSLGIPAGQCFGLLGVNGAGKTTTLKMLTGDTEPTDGTAGIHGYDLRSQMREVRREVGYCPQFDPLLELMSAREHLLMYGRFRLHGTAPEVLTALVNALLKKLGLMPYADVPSGSLSGGNQRKLSLGIALIGDPAVVFLDEPSTGMDPVSRRSMWDVIARVSQQRSVILTSHLMEECEALCHRIGIMSAGKLACLGSVQHLKSRFGAGYQLELKVHDDAQTTAAVKAFISQTFAGAVLFEEHAGAMKYRLPDPNASLSHIFGAIERNKVAYRIEDYSVSQSTLEQTFILMAKRGAAANPNAVPTDE